MTFIREMGDELGAHLLVSTARVIVSLLAALLPAVLLGMVLGRVESLDRYAAPLIYLTYPVPKIIFLPVVITLLGLGNLSKIFLISIIVFFQILVTTRDAARQVNKGMVDSVISLGAESCKFTATLSILPALPKILTSLRISLDRHCRSLFPKQ